MINNDLLYEFVVSFCLSDINECTKGTDECSNGCTNTIGSYKCYCPNGYELDADLTTCVGKLCIIISL